MLPVEEQILTDFFHAARLHDTTMVARVSDVGFNPATEGIVEDFDVVARERRSETERVATLDAAVRRPDGSTARRTLVAVITRAADGRWRLVRLTPGPETGSGTTSGS